MTEFKFKMSEEFNEMLKECLTHNKLTLSWIQRRWKLGFNYACILYQEYKNYKDIDYLVDCVSVLNSISEIHTPATIMDLFNVSYYLSLKIFDSYLEGF